LVHLKKIESRGFKSLGSRQMSIPVERGFIAITGPNGSGKSNLLDAIIFCLGENSPKTLRVPNLGALIYDGSVEEQKPSSAKVTLQFDNSDRRIPFDSDSVTISRELKQSGESVYSLNGKHIQRNNLSEVLEVALITSRGLNIVLQGMITRISELIPDEKRKLIEQMVGVAQFDEKKDMAMKQLDDADRKLEIAMAKIGEIRDRVQQLEQERNDQLRVRQLEDQVSWLRATSLSSRLLRVRSITAQRKSAVADFSTKLQQLQSRQNEIRALIESLDIERSQLIKSAMDAGAAKVELEVGKLSNEIGALQRARSEATDYVDKIRQVLPTYDQMSAEGQLRISRIEEQIAALRQKLESFDNEKAEIISEQNQLASERIQIEKEIDTARKKQTQLRKSKDIHDRKLQSARDTLNRLLSELQSARDRKISAADKIVYFEESLSKARNNIQSLEDLLSSQRSALDNLKSSRLKMERLSRKVDAQLGIALMILEKATTAVRDYDSEYSALENVAGEDMAIAKLNELGDSNALEGYFGPLRSLITYNEEFAQAVAAIGKDWLNAVIVRDLAALLRVTEAARKIKISRLTAIPLREVGKAHIHDKPQMPGVVAYASDVVSTDKGLKSVVDFVFGDAVIVDSAKNAFVAARKGFRAVTLQGDIFEPDILAYQTGYSKKYLQVATLLSQQESYEGIRTVLAALQRLIERRRESISTLHTKGRGFVENEHGHDLEISKIESSLETTRQFVSRYADEMKRLSERQIQAEQEIRRKETETVLYQRKISALILGSEKLVQLVSALDLSAFDLKTSELNKKRNDLELKVDAVFSKIRDSTTEMTRLRGELENNQKPALEKLRSQKAESEIIFAEKSKFLSDSVEKLALLQRDLEQLRIREAETLDRAARYQPMLDSLDSRLKELRIEDEAVRKGVAQADREYYSTNNDLSRLVESERTLTGELAILGYTEPIEAFEGVDDLLRELQAEFDTLRTSVNFNADRNYREIFENYKYSSVRKNELEKERNAIVTFIETIDSEKRKVFMDAFEKIDRELRVIFTKITGGNAWLEIEKPDSIFDSGVFLIAQFPGKLPRDSSSVSGGEKTMSALSFILAIQAVFPSPFYVFDEVDAHLDSVYSGNLAAILAERCAHSQIVIVSLKDTVVSKATSVIGVYMSQGSSKVIRYKSGMEVEVRNE
jgi:chromosome segregation protein